MVFAAALPLGCTGEAEMMDVVLSQPIPPRRVLRGLARAVPEGLTPVDVKPIYDRAPALPTLLYGADYDAIIETDQSVEDATGRCQVLLARDSIPRVFRGKTYDLRPLIDDLEVLGMSVPHLLIRMRLAIGERGTGRPQEVLDELGYADLSHRSHRRRLRFAPSAQAIDDPS
jgi:radical SAM-linked protein